MIFYASFSGEGAFGSSSVGCSKFSSVPCFFEKILSTRTKVNAVETKMQTYIITFAYARVKRE